MIQPLGSFIYAERLLAAPDSETIALPDDCQEMTYDLTVLAAGPGVTQAQVGDRVIIQAHDWWEYNHAAGWCETGFDDCDEGEIRCCFCGEVVRRGFKHRRWMVPPGTNVCSGYEVVHRGAYACREDCTANRGFTSERALVAVIPGPDHSEIYSCNDYVLIEPDKLYKQDGGNVVQERPSGILVASHALTGAEERYKHEGWLAYEESKRLWDSPRAQDEPEYYRHRRIHDFLDGLHPEVRRWAFYYNDTQKEAPGHSRRWVQREVPTRGVVVDYSVEGPVLHYDKPGWEIGYLCAGEVVHWSGKHIALVLQVGERSLLAMRASFLDAVEVE